MSTPQNMFWKLVDAETGAANHDIDWSFTDGDQVKVRIVNAADSDHPMQHPTPVPLPRIGSTRSSNGSFR